MPSSDLILLWVPVTQAERSGPRAGWMRDKRCSTLLKGASVLQHLCGRWVRSWAYVHPCVCVCVCVCMCVCMYVSAHMWAGENSHVEMCTATACSWMWVYAAHMERTKGRRRREDRKTDRWIASDFWDENNEEESTFYALHAMCDRGRLLKLL